MRRLPSETPGYEGQFYSTTVCRGGLPPFDAPSQVFDKMRPFNDELFWARELGHGVKEPYVSGRVS